MKNFYGALAVIAVMVALGLGVVNYVRQVPVNSNGEIKFGAAGNMVAEDYIPYVMYNEGYNSAKDIKTSANISSAAATFTGLLTGASATFSSTMNVTGATTLGSAYSSALNFLESSEVIAATNAIGLSESNKTFYITTGTVNTLPVHTAGAVYRFVISGAITADATIVSDDGADIIEGSMIVAGAVVDCDAEDKITFVADGENLGDFIELRSDGTKWFIGASGALTTSKMTCTAT